VLGLRAPCPVENRSRNRLVEGRTTAAEVRAVVEYRAYLVGIDGHFVGYEPIVCADDAEAIEKAKRWLTATTLSEAAPGWFVKLESHLPFRNRFELLRRCPVLQTGNISMMTDPTRKEELEPRFEQSRRLSSGATDNTTHERLAERIDDLEKKLTQEEK
jgi:hypothetical protein